jgi:antitoxin VapB
MALNIKNEETHRLALQLADATGVSITEAVTQALKDQLDRLEVTRQARYERLIWIVNDCASRIPAGTNLHEEIDALYDENGLPA